MFFNRKGDKYFQSVYPKIIDSIRLFASAACIQISIFQKNEYPPDEIADISEFVMILTEELMRREQITKKQYYSIKIIDEKFDSFDSDDWTIEAMYNSDKWSEIRQLAKIALVELSVSYEKPNLHWIVTF